MGAGVLWLALMAVPSAAAADVTGTVKDATGGALVGAKVSVLTAQRAVIATVLTDQGGKFSVPTPPDGEYVILAQHKGLADRQVPVTISGAKPVTVDLVLDLAVVGETVSVTATPSEVTDLGRSSQAVNVINAEQVLARAKTVVAQAFEGETGVNLQRTSPGMASVFVRGLTGNKVNVFIDGVRYSTGAQRGGVNTFLDLIDPAVLGGIEVLRGTTSAQHGSDALGGSIQFLTQVPLLSADTRPSITGTLTMGAETAHNGGFGAATLGYARSHFGIQGTFSGRKTGDYRPGGGVDTHAAMTRFLGVPSDDLIGERMPDTGFQQFAGHIRTNWVPAANMLVVGSYMSSRQDQANRWDQILGGDGNLIAELNDLQLDFGYLRLERLGAGWFDHASATYSFNTQREERVNQGGQGDPNASIVHQPERTTVHGVQGTASKQLTARQKLLIGGDAYFEGHDSDSFDVNPNTGAAVKSRPRVPDGATYKQGGIYAQTAIDVSRMVITGAVRAGWNRYAAHEADAWTINGLPGWPDDSLSIGSFTARLGAAVRATDEWTFTGSVSSGYRAPHMTDLGTLGLTGSGFEVAAPDVAGLNGSVGSTADASAVSTGRPVEQVESETSLNVDGAVRFRNSRVRVSAGMFVNTIDGNIQKQTLILPQGNVGTSLGGQEITSQNANGAVFVALSANPVLVRANFDRARIWGFETDGDVKLAPQLSAGWSYTYMEARDTTTDLPPNIEGGTPAPSGTVWGRWTDKNNRWWIQPYIVFAAEQNHLSSLDATDRRTGAGRTRGQIQNFFRRGATVRGWIDPGADGTFGNADDILIETGETLALVQDRVLGPGVNSSPLWTAVPSYTLVGIQFAVRVGPHAITVEAENLTDESYRGISWGMDGAGRGLTVRYSVAFK